jgi:hypothetical protein
MVFPIPKLSAEAIFGNVAGLAQLINSSLAVDIVAVYNQETNEQVFQYARPLEATQNKILKVMDYPVEDGTLISDHAISLPIYVELPLVVPIGDYLATYQEIESLMYKHTKLIVQTKTDVLFDFIIEAMPDRQTPDAFDKAMVRLRLKQVQVITSPTVFAPADPVNEPTVKRGQVSPPAKETAQIEAAPAPTRVTTSNALTGWRTGIIVPENSKPLNLSGK